MNSYRYLVDSFEKTKRELSDTEHILRRLTGRDPGDEILGSVSRSGKYRLSSTAVPGRPSFSERKKPYTTRKRSRERESSFEEESSTDEESSSKKPVLQSTVVAKKHEKRSRKATIQEQNANSKIKARNRRMFGALIGTLEKFKREEKKREHKESMRAEIEQKVEAATEEERERIKKEKEHLFITRREKQTQLRCLEKKIERAESHKVFVANHHYMLKFIMTKSKPPIFFLPSSHTPVTKKSLAESRAKIIDLINKQSESYNGDLSEIEELYRKDPSMPGDKENKSPKEEIPPCDVPEKESEPVVVEQEDVVCEPNSNSNSHSDSNRNDDEDSSNTKNIDSFADQDFEPIYD